MEPKRKTQRKKRASPYHPSSHSVSKQRTACKRCRSRKTKCDPGLSSCKACQKANQPCVAVDPVTGQDAPRSYMSYLENRIAAMAWKLTDLGVTPDDMSEKVRPVNNEAGSSSSSTYVSPLSRYSEMLYDHLNKRDSKSLMPPQQTDNDMSVLGLIKNDCPNSFLGDSSGILFAKLVCAAVNFTADPVNKNLDDNSDTNNNDTTNNNDNVNDINNKNTNKKGKNNKNSSNTNEKNKNNNNVDEDDDEVQQRQTMYKLYEEAENDKNFDPLELPSRKIAETFIDRFFVDTNSQLPIFHRELFLKRYFEPIYGPWNPKLPLASGTNKINIPFEWPSDLLPQDSSRKPPYDKPWYNIWYNSTDKQHLSLPPQYDIPYFFLNIVFAIGSTTQLLKSDILTVVKLKRRATKYVSSLLASNDRLETLTGIILLTIYAIMRPTVPGAWYVLGSALRLTVDLGLHSEKINKQYEPFTRDLRRRLFWSVYALDRQICSYFGRPVGIPEENITTIYPSILDDSFIFPNKEISYSDFSHTSNLSNGQSSCKVIALAMFKIRRIQAHIISILYAPHSQLPRHLNDLESWRTETYAQLEHWYLIDVPKSFTAMNCKFNELWFDLNFHYSKSILYGLSPKSSTLNDKAFTVVHSGTRGTIDVFYRLCTSKRMGYSWVAVHNIFMAGMTYLYVICYSSADVIKVDQEIVMGFSDKVLFVLKNLIGTCEAAKNCYESFKILSSVVMELKFPEISDNNSIGNDSVGDTTGTVKSAPMKSEPSFDTDIRSTFHLPLEDLLNGLENNSIGHDTTFNAVDSSLNPGVPNSSAVQDPQSHIDNNVSLSGMTSVNVNASGLTTTTATTTEFTDKDMMDILFPISSKSVWDDLFSPASSNKNETPYGGAEFIQGML